MADFASDTPSILFTFSTVVGLFQVEQETNRELSYRALLVYVLEHGV